VSTDDALQRARSAGMDLVEVAPNERPPVCRIMDYGKFKYSQKRKKQRHREQRLKEIRLHPDIGDHDREIKLKQAIAFLEKGDKVQFTMIFRGRERHHKEIGFEMYNAILEQLGDTVKVERPPRSEGQRMIMVIAPVKR
jgi:translation initiation factor IF-3